MAEQYFEPSPQSVSSPLVFEESVRGVRLRLATDRGVFSRGKLDAGTRVLIEAIELPPAAAVLDLGCGYGPVGLALAVSDPSVRVWAVDVNGRAVELARLNAAKNGVSERFSAWQADGREPPRGGPFDVIALNPPIRAGKEVVQGLFRAAREQLGPEGALYTVIRKRQGAESAERFLRGLYPFVDLISRSSGYRVYRCGVDERGGERDS